MYKVLVGGISPAGEHLLTSYLNAFMPDYTIEPLVPAGIKGKLKNKARKDDCFMVILDESLYQSCVGVVDDVLSLPKVHKYVNDEGLEQYLIQKFGRSLDESVLNNTGVIPPDVLMQGESAPEDVYIPKNADIFAENNSNSTPVPDIINSVAEDTDVNLAVTEDDITEQESYDDTINKLRSELAVKDMLVKNLTLQLEDKGTDGDIEAFVARIKELETALEAKQKELDLANEDSYVKLDKVVRADGILSEFNSLKDEIKRINKDKSVIIYERDKFKGETDLLKGQVDDLKTQVVQVSILQQELTEKEAELVSANEKLSGVSMELETTKASLSGVSTELETTKTALSGVSNELETTKTALSGVSTELETLKSSSGDIMEKYDEATKALASKEAELKSANDTIASLEADLSSKENDINESLSLLDESEEKLEKYEANISELTEKVSILEESVKGSESKYNNMVDDYETKLSESDNRLEEFARLLEETQNEKDNLKTELASYDSSISKLKSENADLASQVEQLTKSISSTDEVSDEVAKLQEELDEERKKSAKLESELDVIKNNDDSGKSSELRLKVAKLRNELDKTKKELELSRSETDSSELSILKDELIESRKRCGDLEISIEEQKSIIDELSGGIFGKMANVAMPKFPYDLNLPELHEGYPNFVCIASGSHESSSVVYSTLKRSCVTNAAKHFLIVDLVTDSTVDREFGVKGVSSPIQWLNGSDPFKQFLASTSMDNVKVLSTALAYLNDLYLLKIDWEKRLSELKGFADVVIINIGCLNNLVSKILFNTFSKVMTTYVITKASPINLRSAMLNLTGIYNLSPNVTVECVNYDEKASRVMYQRLVSKYKAQILKESDVLKL